MTNTPERAPDINAGPWSVLTRQQKAHPLFRLGYQLGVQERAHLDHLATLDANGPNWRNNDQPQQPPHAWYNVTQNGLRNELAAGDVAQRELTRDTESQVTTTTPCCGRQIEMIRPEDDKAVHAACCKCGITYRVELVQLEPEWDDDPPWEALFTVEHLAVATALHRRGKAEPNLRPPT